MGAGWLRLHVCIKCVVKRGCRAEKQDGQTSERLHFALGSADHFSVNGELFLMIHAALSGSGVIVRGKLVKKVGAVYVSGIGAQATSESLPRE